MRLPFVSRRAFENLALALAAVRSELVKAETAARRLPQTEVEMERNDLRKRVAELVAAVDQLRLGTVDDAQTVELRRQLGIERQTNRALEQRLYEMTLANQLHDQQLHAKESDA